MAIRAVEACGGFPMSVFFYGYSMLDEVQRCGSKQRLWSQGPEAISQACCVLAVHAWILGQDFCAYVQFCAIFVPYNTKPLACCKNEKGQCENPSTWYTVRAQ